MVRPQGDEMLWLVRSACEHRRQDSELTPINAPPPTHLLLYTEPIVHSF